MKLKTILISLVFLISLSFTSNSDEALKNYLRTFMDNTCCYTNDCCFVISHIEVTDLGEGLFRINSTGQEIKRRDYSPDGQYWRCACDSVPVEGSMYGKWLRHDKANTRCLYTPRFGS